MRAGSTRWSRTAWRFSPCSSFHCSYRQGRGNAGIAAQLYLSEPSAEKHVNAIFTRLGLTSEQSSHRRVTAVLTFPRDAGLRG